MSPWSTNLSTIEFNAMKTALISICLLLTACMNADQAGLLGDTGAPMMRIDTEGLVAGSDVRACGDPDNGFDGTSDTAFLSGGEPAVDETAFLVRDRCDAEKSIFECGTGSSITLPVTSQGIAYQHRGDGNMPAIIEAGDNCEAQLILDAQSFVPTPLCNLEACSGSSPDCTPYKVGNLDSRVSYEFDSEPIDKDNSGYSYRHIVTCSATVLVMYGCRSC